MGTLISFIPDEIKRELLDALVGFLANQAKRMVGEKLSDRIRRLSSEAGFLRAFDEAFPKAIRRFVDEYTPIDEDLVAAITADPNNFWSAPSVREALRDLVRRPGAWLPEERERLARHFAAYSRSGSTASGWTAPSTSSSAAWWKNFGLSPAPAKSARSTACSSSISPPRPPGNRRLWPVSNWKR